jgi:hypothetical protein
VLIRLLWHCERSVDSFRGIEILLFAPVFRYLLTLAKVMTSLTSTKFEDEKRDQGDGCDISPLRKFRQREPVCLLNRHIALMLLCFRASKRYMGELWSQVLSQAFTSVDASILVRIRGKVSMDKHRGY